PYEFVYGLRYDSKSTDKTEAESRNQGKLEGEGKISDTNLFGSAQSAFFYGKVTSGFQRYVLGYDSPSLWKLRWNAILSFSQDRTQDPLRIISIFSFQQQYSLGGPFHLLALFKHNRIHNRIQILDEILDFRVNISRLLGVLLADTRDDP